MLGIAWSLAAVFAVPVGEAATGDRWNAASANFVVRNTHASQDARQVAERCEQWRAKLARYWCAGDAEAWSPKCEVVVHRDGQSYLAAVGAGAARTFGSSLIKFGADGKAARRLIDFRGDSRYGADALAHEMTHVIVADLLDGRQPPRWADEGMAILADTHEKQMLHERDLARAMASGTAFRVTELLTLDSYPAAARVPAFYGQSASVTALLAKRDDPAKFIEFLRRSLDEGYDRALREIYHLKNAGQLERLWSEERLAWKSGYHGVRVALE
jgi:hypothetical protein